MVSMPLKRWRFSTFRKSARLRAHALGKAKHLLHGQVFVAKTEAADLRCREGRIAEG